LRDATFGNQTFANHNHLLGKVIGLDGIKTGYTVDAGFTLAASAMRNNRRLIAVVLGEPSIAVRNRMRPTCSRPVSGPRRSRHGANGKNVADVLPTASHPAFRDSLVTEQGRTTNAAVAEENAPATDRSKSAPAVAAHQHRPADECDDNTRATPRPPRSRVSTTSPSEFDQGKVK